MLETVGSVSTASPGTSQWTGDLALDVVVHVVVRAADDGIRLDADAAELSDAVLSGLGLELAGGRYVGQESYVYV